MTSDTRDAISSYAMDVYVDRLERVWIVDFNVWGDRTDSLLFDWEYLRKWSTEAETEERKEAEIRVVETDRQVLPDSLNNYRAPVDTVHLAALTGGNPDKFEAFMDLCDRPGSNDNDSSTDQGEREEDNT